MSMFGAIIGITMFFLSGPFCILKKNFGTFLMMLNIAAYFAGHRFAFGPLFAEKWRLYLQTAEPTIVRDQLFQDNFLYLSLRLLPQALFVSIPRKPPNFLHNLPRPDVRCWTIDFPIFLLGIFYHLCLYWFEKEFENYCSFSYNHVDTYFFILGDWAKRTLLL